MTQNLGEGFADPAALDASALIEALRRQEANGDSEDRYQVKYDVLALQPGERVLDIGCGAGRDLFRMAPLVGSSGSLTGLDINPQMVEHTRQRISDAGVSNIHVQQSNGRTLPFPDGTFDVVHTERVLVFVEEPDGLIAEMVRVLRPGGRVVCCEFDNVPFIDLDEMALVEKVYARGGAFTRNTYLGRQLYRRLKGAGLEDVEVRGFLRTSAQPPIGLRADLERAVAEGWITANEMARFEASVQALADAGKLFTATPSFLARGWKRGASSEMPHHVPALPRPGVTR